MNYSYTELGTLGGRTINPLDINDHNHVVGSSEVEEGVYHAFLYNPDSDSLINFIRSVTVEPFYSPGMTA